MRKLSISLVVIFLFHVFHLSAQSKGSLSLPEVIVYKTKKDYRNLVPVVLSADRKSVVSYPDPADLKTGGAYAVPVSLHKRFLLDRRGVGAHTAFTRLTYHAYSRLKKAPSPAELYKMLIDKNPMTALYDCGKRAPMKDLVHRLNEAIDRKKLDKICTPVKDVKTGVR